MHTPDETPIEELRRLWREEMVPLIHLEAARREIQERMERSQDHDLPEHVSMLSAAMGS